MSLRAITWQHSSYDNDRDIMVLCDGDSAAGDVDDGSFTSRSSWPAVLQAVHSWQLVRSWFAVGVQLVRSCGRSGCLGSQLGRSWCPVGVQLVRSWFAVGVQLVRSWQFPRVAWQLVRCWVRILVGSWCTLLLQLLCSRRLVPNWFALGRGGRRDALLHTYDIHTYTPIPT